MDLSCPHRKAGPQQHVKLEMVTSLLFTKIFKSKVRKDQNLFASSEMQIWLPMLLDYPGTDFYTSHFNP